MPNVPKNVYARAGMASTADESAAGTWLTLDRTLSMKDEAEDMKQELATLMSSDKRPDAARKCATAAEVASSTRAVTQDGRQT